MTSAVTNHNVRHRFPIWSHPESEDLFRLLTNVIGPKIFVSGPMTVYREVMGLCAANHMTRVKMVKTHLSGIVSDY